MRTDEIATDDLDSACALGDTADIPTLFEAIQETDDAGLRFQVHRACHFLARRRNAAALQLKLQELEQFVLLAREHRSTAPARDIVLCEFEIAIIECGCTNTPGIEIRHEAERECAADQSDGKSHASEPEDDRRHRHGSDSPEQIGLRSPEMERCSGCEDAEDGERDHAANAFGCDA